ncbi:gluconolaconase [Kibdelosporangium aridum]|uniref:Gluconolaconase n=1 Tax=Kibdelosporangium aridum TaxID=2030 RepID=A0A428ZQW0_KIBAR|nr:SMP-30/gluconolactonase/LRE family protein [Kibdelosporangium aridum]RSM90442.1 gluconolaconase [Kibdelosporangium aridum]
MRRRGLRSVVLALIVVAAIPVPASAAENRPCPDFVLGNGPTLHPEGIAYDGRRDRFLVGSVTHGTVSVVQADGSVRTLVNDPKLITTMGLAVDRGKVLAVNGDIGIGDRSTPETIGKTAGLGIYDLYSGRQIRYVDLAALDPQRPHFGNDVAVAPDGTAYVTDSRSGAVYRVPPYGSPSILIRDDRLMPAGSGNGANGIVWHPGGFLLVAHSAGRSLWRIPLRDPANLAQVTVTEPIGALDGLLLTGATTLDGIDNTRANRVLRLSSTDGWRTATVRESLPWPDPAPTTMARGRCGTYVLTGRLDQLLSGTRTDEFRLRALRF